MSAPLPRPGGRGPTDQSDWSSRAPVVVRPGSKINLSLEVVGRRSDGYHDLATVFQAIDLTDELAISPADSISLTCQRAVASDSADPGDHVDLSELAGEGNLAHRAATLLREAAGVTAGARISLTKHVPIAAGLGGGSADAAGALVGCARLWGLDWPMARLVDLAARLGSDCAFFVDSPGTARAEGRGERLTHLPPLAPHHVVVVRPRLRRVPPSDKTRRVYSALSAADYRDGAATRALVAAISAGGSVDPELLVNSFEVAAEAVFPEIAAARLALLAAGADWVRLAGSGPCVYTLFAERDIARAEAVLAALRVGGEEAYLARTGTPKLSARRG